MLFSKNTKEKKTTNKTILTKRTISIVIACLFLSLFFSACGRAPTNEQEHAVKLVMITNTYNTDYVLTSRSSGSQIFAPQEYKIYKTAISGHVIENDVWYTNSDLTQTAYFPMTMPDDDLMLFAKARQLTNVNKISFKNADDVCSYFSTNGTIKNEYSSAPDTNDENTYYEITKNNVGINSGFKYYPATKTIVMLRGYSVNQTIANVLVQDSFTAGFFLDLTNKKIKASGVYSRQGASYNSASGGTITMSFSIPSIAIDKPTEPLVPNFESIDYTWQITKATNYSKLNELWQSEQDNYAKKCYNQINTLLKQISAEIRLFY